MPYSSVPERKSREEVDNSEDTPRETRHRYSYHGMQSVPRSCALASTINELRREFEASRYQHATLADTYALDNYAFEASVRHLGDDERRVAHDMKALSLEKDADTTKLVQVGNSHLTRNKTTEDTSSNDGIQQYNITQATQDEQPEASHCPLHRLAEVSISKYEKKLDSGTKDVEAVLYDHLVEEEVVQSQLKPCMPTADIVEITTNDDESLTNVQDEDKELILMLLRDLVYRSSCFREIGSWVHAGALLDQYGEETQPDSIEYPNTITIDPKKTQWSDEDQNGKIAQCAGSTENGRPNAPNRASQLTKRPTRVGKATTNGNKGKRKQTNGDGGDDDDDGNQENIEQANNGNSQKSYNLACPFFKRRSQTFRTNREHRYKFRTCETTPFPNITRLKEHLLRKHKQPITCPRCQEVFNEDDLLTRHLKEAERCPDRPTQLVMAITPSVEAKLRRKTLVPDPIVKWREIYSWIFPGEVVQSPTHEDFPEVVTPTLTMNTSFFSMLTRDMPELLHSELEPRLFPLGFSDAQRACLNDIAVATVASCHLKLWQAYQEQHPNSIEHLPESYEVEGSNSNLAYTSTVDPRFARNMSTPHMYRNRTEPNSSVAHDPLPFYNTQTHFPPTPNTAGASMISAATTASDHHIRLPPTPSYPETSPPFGVKSIFRPGVYSSVSWRSDSGYGTLPPCGRIGCDESSCIACLELMKSPTSQNVQLPSALMPPFQPVASETGDAGFPWHSQNPNNAPAPAHHFPVSTAGAAQHQDDDDDDDDNFFLSSNYEY